jgi:undecaprenyl-diphosphatase
VIAALTLFKTKNRQQFILTLLLAGIAAAILTIVFSKMYYHPRPFVVNNIKPLIEHGNDNGFPSDHTVMAMTIAGAIFFYRRKYALVALILTIAVAAGRILAHVHSLIDILGGIVIGVMSAYIGYVLSRMILKDKKIQHDKT